MKNDQQDKSVTESRNEHSYAIDSMGPLEIARVMNEQDAQVPLAVGTQLETIATVMQVVADALQRGGRLIYVGAGTSGRLGVLDASECPPTFNTDPDQVVGVIAGGHGALVRSVEGAEDFPEDGAREMERLNVSGNDVVMGIATSGQTPYVLGAVQAAKSRGATTAALVCNPETPFEGAVDHLIRTVVGPEIISGSTRLKAGTATKLVLNMITTGAMVLIGKTYGNLMVDLRATNKKLRRRTVGIVRELTELDPAAAQELLDRCDGELKTALVSALTAVSPEVARRRLAACDGHLRAALTKGDAEGDIA